MVGCGYLSFPEQLALEAVKFWARDSYQHIDVLLNMSEAYDVELFPYFQDELKKLFQAYKDIYDDLNEGPLPFNQEEKLDFFIDTNNYFIRTLERLKFEGFNGLPYLYQITYHMLYEQKYVNEIFKSILYPNYRSPEDVLIHAKFRKMGLGDGAINCIYGQIYFWCIIGAEHPSILLHPTPKKLQGFSDEWMMKLLEFTIRFNDCTYELSTLFDKLDPKNLYEVFTKFKTLNSDFLEFLLMIQKETTIELDLFQGLLGHMIHEHEYASQLSDKIEDFFEKSTYFIKGE